MCRLRLCHPPPFPREQHRTQRQQRLQRSPFLLVVILIVIILIIVTAVCLQDDEDLVDCVEGAVQGGGAGVLQQR